MAPAIGVTADTSSTLPLCHMPQGDLTELPLERKLFINCDIESGSFQRETPPVQKHVRVLAYNILRGFEAEKQLDAILHNPQIPRPDILLVSELDRGCPRTQGRNVARDYARRLGMHYVYGVEFIELAGECEHGNAILSRYPLENARVIRFQHNADTFIVGEGKRAEEEPRLGGRMAIYAEAVIGERRLHLYSTHLESSYYDYQYRIDQAAEIANDARNKPYNTVIGGDFNTISYALNAATGWRYHAVTTAFAELGMEDAHWPLPAAERATLPDYPRLVLDLIFAREGTTREPGLCTTTLCKSLSDHYPIWTDVEVTPPQQRAPRSHLAAHPALPDSPLAIGHRGAGHRCAENTAACFEQALALGAQAFEADLQVLGDGTLVMFHDDNTLRQTGRDLDLADIDLETFRQLDLGWAYSEDDGTSFPLRGQGLRGMSFQEFLAAFPDTPILLDVKPESTAMAEALLKFVPAHFSARDYERVYIKSNSWRLPRRLRALEPPPRVAFSRYERMALLLLPSLLEGTAPSWIDLEPRYLSDDIVRWAHAQNHVITTSTVDEASAIADVLQRYDIDGVVSNYPQRVRDQIDAGNIPLRPTRNPAQP